MAGAASKIRIGFALYPDADLLDVAGPAEVLAAMNLAAVQYQAELLFVASDRSLLQLGPVRMQPAVTFSDCPPLDVLAVPGGMGVLNAMEDANYIQFLRTQAKTAKYVFSVCTGALALAAAGLLEGYEATTHWASLCCLGLFPEVTLAAGYPRYVVSGNRITTGGVSSGIDGAFALGAILFGEQAAKDAQLFVQYAPDPPYRCGNPAIADPVTMGQTAALMDATRRARVAAILAMLKQ